VTKIENVEKILLIGPSTKIKELSKQKILDYINGGGFIFSYGESIKYLKTINIVPDFHIFIDPLSWCKSEDAYSEQFKQKTTLFALNDYKDNLKKFYTWATCNGARRYQGGHRFKKFEKLEFINNYNEIFWFDSKKINIDEIKVEQKIDFKDDIVILGWSKKTGRNNDKFSCFAMPLIINVFENLKNLHIVGFGDLQVGRWHDPAGTRGLSEARITFNAAAKYLSQNIIKNNIQISFEHDNYYNRMLTKALIK
tara:strand:+ start:532 stop:1290 length:759 start_codon:yes stop_codon:yes gene_type:complete